MSDLGPDLLSAQGDLGDDAAPAVELDVAEVPSQPSDVPDTAEPPDLGEPADLGTTDGDAWDGEGPNVPTSYDILFSQCLLQLVPDPASQTVPPDDSIPIGKQQKGIIGLIRCCEHFTFYVRGPLENHFVYMAFKTFWPNSKAPCPDIANQKQATVPLKFDCSKTGAKVKNLVDIHIFEPFTDTSGTHTYEYTTEWTLPARCNDASDWDATCCPPDQQP